MYSLAFWKQKTVAKKIHKYDEREDLKYQKMMGLSCNLLMYVYPIGDERIPALRHEIASTGVEFIPWNIVARNLLICLLM